MDIKPLSDVQKQTFQLLLDKLAARSKFTKIEAENFQNLLENVRDTKNFHFIMEKLKDSGCFEFDKIDEGNLGWKLNRSIKKKRSFHLSDNGICLKDTARKFGPGGQTLTPRHTIDAILGLNNRNGEGGGTIFFCY